jgi:hypothetical protein
MYKQFYNVVYSRIVEMELVNNELSFVIILNYFFSLV